MSPKKLPLPPALTQTGRFAVGCNYWASHAGTRMWSDWRPAVVRRDLRQLAAAGLRILRVFPLWPDFQPITLLTGYAGRPAEVRLPGDAPLPPDEAGQAGLDPTALDRFEFLADQAAHNGQQLLVGLVTGWMSGRLFVPPAIEGRNPLTDPFAIRWQIRFVRAFVRRFKNHPALAAWDLGNECNCMGAVRSSDEAWAWTSHLTAAIRAEDPTRPIVSGMHSLGADTQSAWTIRDQAELTDVLTTHPYPLFTPHCDQDPLDTLRPTLHATAESLLYAGIGGKPCCAEELGTLGPMLGGERQAAAHIRTVLFTLWAHDCRAMLWWCAYDQDRLDHPPYDWNALERELGLFRADRAAKPALRAISRFAARLDALPLKELPPRLTQAVCVLSEGQDAWAVAYSAMILARQAHLDITFRFAGQPLPEAPLYLLPSAAGMHPFPRRVWQDLLARVARGATLYLSLDNAFLSPFHEPFGLRIDSREKRTAPAVFTLDSGPDSPVFSVAARYRNALTPTGSVEVLGREPDGNPAFLRTAHGKGFLYLLTVPLEQALAGMPGCFHRPDAAPYWRIYRRFAAPFLRGRIAADLPPQIGVTEHPLPDGRRVLVLVNHSPVAVQTPLALARGWSVRAAWYGTRPVNGLCRIPANDALVLLTARRARG